MGLGGWRQGWNCLRAAQGQLNPALKDGVGILVGILVQAVFIFYCCVKNHHKFSRLKQHKCTVSQFESRSSVTEFSAQGLM